MTTRDLIRTATCAREKLDRGDACVCQCFGQGAGLGWLISVQCGGDAEISWVQPATRPGEGVGYVRDFDCDTLRADLPDLLEQLDNLRADEVAAENCFDYVASFFTDDTGRPMDVAARDDQGAWVHTYCNQVTIPPGTLQAGDVVIFRGRGTGDRPGSAHVSHVAIATGHGDEISQLWYPRETQEAMVARGDFKPSTEELNRTGRGEFYAVTRESLGKLISDFTDQAGQPYIFSPYEVWRISDPRWGNFSEFIGCE